MAGNRNLQRRDRCKGCELCTSGLSEAHRGHGRIQPPTARAITPPRCATKTWTKCVGCASCAKICPDSIITVEKFCK